MSTHTLTGVECETLSLAETCKVLGISTRLAYRLLAEGRFPIRTIRIGKLYKFSKVAVENYLAAAEVGA